MWNAMVPALTVGCRLLAYDGSPFYPDVRSFLKMISDQGYVSSLSLTSYHSCGLTTGTNVLTCPARDRVTIFGTGPRFLTEVQSAGIDPSASAFFLRLVLWHRPNALISSHLVIALAFAEQLASFESLRVIMSTGSPLTAPMFEWTQQVFGPDVHVVSVSGGTDICTGCAFTLYTLG